MIGPAGVVFVVDHGHAVDVRHAQLRRSSTNPRVFFAMADGWTVLQADRGGASEVQDARTSRSCSRAALGVIFVLLRTFEQLADTFVTAILPFYALGVASIFVLRRRPGYAPAFRTPVYPVAPILFMLATLYLLVNAVIDPRHALADDRRVRRHRHWDPGLLRDGGEATRASRRRPERGERNGVMRRALVLALCARSDVAGRGSRTGSHDAAP